MKFPVRINHHLVVSDSEHQAIINALAFYNEYHTTPLLHDKDRRDQFTMAFNEDNRGIDQDGPIKQLSVKIANSK